MNIAGINYHLNRKCLEIYISGCKPPHCEGCHNKNLQNFINIDNLDNYKKVINLRILTGMVNEVWLLGGEPLDQNLEKLEELIKFIKNQDKKIKIWLWTKYEDFNKIKFLYLIDYIKSGKYDKNLPSYHDKKHDIKLASSNQKIIKISNF